MAETDRWSLPERWAATAVPLRPEEPFDTTAVEAVRVARPVVVSTIDGAAEAFDGFASALPIGSALTVATDLLVA